MNTIVLGFKTHSNGKGTGPATLIAGPEVSGHEQAAIVSNAKARGEFPKGISFVQLVLLTPRITAISNAAPAVENKSKKIEPRKEI